MRILMTTDAVGGVFVYSAELIRELLACGHQVTLAVLGRPLSDAQRLQLPDVEVVELPGALEWMEDPWQDVAATSGELARLAERVQPDCVHLNEYAHAALPWPAPVLVVGHSCVLSWWQAVHREPAPHKYEHYRRVVREGLKQAGYVVAPSQAQLRELARLYGALPHARAISNGIDLSAFTAQTKQPMIVSAGRLWDAAKNAALLQRVAAELSWPVFLVGETRSPDGQHALLDPACRALGQLTRAELADVLGRAAIYALPARYEPFGLSVLEAAASGCALVLGRVPSLIEHWAGAACFVDPEDPGELSHTLQSLIDDRQRCELWGQEARRRSRAFGAAQMARAYEQVYGQLARSQHGGVSCAS